MLLSQQHPSSVWCPGGMVTVQMPISWVGQNEEAAIILHISSYCSFNA